MLMVVLMLMSYIHHMHDLISVVHDHLILIIGVNHEYVVHEGNALL